MGRRVTRLVIADAHVGTQVGDADAMVEMLTRCVPAGITEVIYLGDSFKYLIGMAKFWTRSVAEVITAWDEIRAAGVKVRLIEGNRDFFLDEAELASRIDSSHLQIDFEQCGRRYRLVHGDKVNQRDFQYLFWSAFSKAFFSRLFARWLPRRLALRIVQSMEQHMATTNKKFRYTKPEAALKREADKAFADGVDVLLWGHFHTLWRYDVAASTAMVVPAWLEHRLALLLQDDGNWIFVNPDLEPVDV